jgi:phosphonate transport system substrate-binding protein
MTIMNLLARCLQGLVFALSLHLQLVAPVLAQDERPLRLGIHPYAGTLALISAHKPLQQYLSAQLGRPVEFYTAPSFNAFVDVLFAGGYDIAISPPHFAVLATETHYVPLVRYRSQLEPVLTVRKDQPFQRAEDFRGKRIAMADASAVIRIATVKWFADHGLQAGVDYQIVERPTHGASVAAAAMGEADAGLITVEALKLLPADLQAQIRVLGTGERMPHLFTLANRALGEAEIARIKRALLAFPATEPGRLFMDSKAFRGYEEVTPADIRALMPYVDIYRRMNDPR